MSNIKMKHVSASEHGLWAVGAADGTIYRLFGDAGLPGLPGWVPDKVGKAEVIAAVDSANLWCVNKAHEIWQLVDTFNLSEGGTWNQIPTASATPDAQAIAVGPKGSVWYAATDGKMYRRENNTWIKDPVGLATAISIGSWNNQDDVWCVNKAGEIFNLVNGGWVQRQTFSGKADARSIAAGTNGTVVRYVDIQGGVFYSFAHGDTWMADPNWNTAQMGAAQVITSPSEIEAYCLNKSGEIWGIVAVRNPNADLVWQKVAEIGPEGKHWAYTAGQGDHLMAIVRKEFHLQSPKDDGEINRLVDMIVIQNKPNLSHLTRDMVRAGDKLSLNY